MTGKARITANAIEDSPWACRRRVPGFRTMFNQALAQQKAVYEATLKMWSRLFAVPRVIDWARDVKVGTTPSEIVYEEDTSACFAIAATRRPSTPSRSWSAMPWSTAPTSSTCNPTGA